MVRYFALSVGLLGCGDQIVPHDAAVARVEVALVPSAAPDAVDVLFVLQDSCCALDKQTVLKRAMSRFVDELAALPGGLPSLHIGVVSSDLGTSSSGDAVPAPSVGIGAGSCAGTGRAGALQTNGTVLVNGNFIRDETNIDGSRTTNYTGSLPAALSAIASPGASGCGFEQHLRAAQVALAGNAANVGFRRADAALAVIILAEDEDCSAGSTALFEAGTGALGPFNTFRCIRYGVTCDVGGETPDAMNILGVKSGCHSNEDSPVISPVASIVGFLETLVDDPRQLMLAVIAGDREPVEIVLRTSQGGGAGTPAIAASCSVQGPNGPEIAQPGVRLVQAAELVRRHVVATSCSVDDSATVTTIARQLRGLVGDRCLADEILLPADCEVADELVDGTRWAIPACTSTRTDGCYTLAPDTSCTTTHQLRVDVKRVDPPRAGTMLSVRCRG